MPDRIEAPHYLVTMTEQQWQDLVVDAAKQLGWAVYHTHDSRRSDPGYPDLCCVRAGNLLFLELKTERGRIKRAQRQWIALLAEVPGVVALIARPRDWDQVEALLRGLTFTQPDPGGMG